MPLKLQLHAVLLQHVVAAVFLQADAIAIKGAGPGLFRYCQQCGKVEPLSRFQAGKR